MSSQRFLPFFTAVLILIGQGCASKPADAPSDVSSLQPAEAASAIQFKKGSSFEVHQRALKVQGLWVREEPELSQRVVTLNEFIPGDRAEIQWTLQQRVLTDEYKQALEQYRVGTTTTEPKVTYGMFITAGALKGLLLRNTHDTMVPTFWPEGEARSFSNSALWLSSDVYQELTRTGVSTVYLDLMDRAASMAADRPELAAAVKLVRERADEAGNRTDLDLMKAETARSTRTLQVNGIDVTVQVLKASNWYGEMTVLDNPNNPLILGFVFNPPVQSNATSTDLGFLNDLLSYQITRIDF